MSTSLCGNCEYKTAQKRCNECSELFCIDCASFHSKVKQFRTHKSFSDYTPPAPAAAILCSNCDAGPGKFECSDCKRCGNPFYFCLGCSVIHSKLKVFQNHALLPLHDLKSFVKLTGSAGVGDGGAAKNVPMEVIEEDEGGGGRMLYAQLQAWFSRLERVMSGSNAAVLQDKQGFSALAVLCVVGYLFLRLLGKNVSIVVAFGGLIGLRWFQQRKQDTTREIKKNLILEEAASAVYSPAESARGSSSSSSSSSSSKTMPPSLGAAAAALDATDQAGQFADEFWHASNVSRRRQPRPMRVQLKDRKAHFDASSDT